MSFKLELIFRDRVGIVADISSLIAEHEFNIVSMEVQRKDDKAYVYVKTENGTHASRKEEIFEILGRISDLIEIRFIETLPQEDRENRFRVVLDNISDGVISIGRDGKITTINKVAKDVLNCQGNQLVGRSIETLNLPDYSILRCLEGKTYTNVKKNLITKTGRYQYFATGRPIWDSSGRIIGAVEIAKDMQEIKSLAKSISEPTRISFSDIIGQHPTITAAISFAQKIASTDSIVLIRGASGTGKELFARAIHTESGRKGPFVPINCAAFPEQLLESELFGYVGGAFTGGRKEGKPGLFEIAKDGTVFLDEIAEMPLSAQAKILRLIHDKRVRRIGGIEEVPVNTRIITATNRNLEQLVEAKLFRQDLYYRINVLPIHIPPLAERIEDIPILVEHFLFQLASKLGKKVQSITKEALNKLCLHSWPGNVRELKNVVERAAILSDGDKIDVDCILFSYEIGKNMKGGLNQAHHKGTRSRSLKTALAEYEKTIILETLEKSSSIRKAAQALGISHTALLNKIKKYQIEMATK
ncbi:sigma 54-interacting transcriptional regulator [Desulfohalobiaceae bacterium Ax17]|uniref:sigma 54-interacting transcriptional regulator n=1 Tax=Desulfovulcanus ferrireducens TaxID=2831190 RepID=UPI00207BCB6C|nr:sigma 54-interacting transcriptional regulator [Desulfovulcanus ferrireducens]MBT8763943.1 sigma 54-interacting transcriptional regulator [Desulfovulcanus ferrireducens]